MQLESITSLLFCLICISHGAWGKSTSLPVSFGWRTYRTSVHLALHPFIFDRGRGNVFFFLPSPLLTLEIFEQVKHCNYSKGVV